MQVSTLTTGYQATIPRTVREALGLGAGDRIEFLVDADGDVRIRKAPPLDAEFLALETSLAPEWDSPADDTAYSSL